MMPESFSQKAVCKKVFEEMLGAAAAAHIDGMSESGCVQQCQERLRSFFDEATVSRFDQLFRAMSSEMRESVGQAGSDKKEKCREIMLELFGPASANRVNDMSDFECVALCREKVKSLLGEKHAKRFDRL